jgi:hypothetical protein
MQGTKNVVRNKRRETLPANEYLVISNRTMPSFSQAVENDQQLELGFESLSDSIAQVFSILPPCRGELDLAAFDAIVLAQQGKKIEVD